MLAGCSSNNAAGTNDADAGTSSTNDTTNDAGTGGADPAPSADVVAELAHWRRIEPGGDCGCADGSEFAFWVRQGDPTRVAVIFQGGGACFDAATCTFVEGPYKPRLFQEDDPNDGDGLLDIDDERNPLADWSMVFVPYCTGDLHLGDAVREDSPEQVVHHSGLANGTAVLDQVEEQFQTATEVLVAGESAGAAAAPLYGGLLADRLSDAQVTVLADGAGAYPNDPAVNELAISRWGALAAVPDWPGTQGLGAADFGLPTLFVHAGRQHPDLRFGRRDFANDQAQVTYAQLAGLSDDVAAQIDRNKREIEAQGIDLAGFVSPGEHHTILTTPYLWDHRVGGVMLVDWIQSLIDGTAVDVR